MVCSSFRSPSHMQGWFSPDRPTEGHLFFGWKKIGHNWTSFTSMEIGKWHNGKKPLVCVYYQDENQDFYRNYTVAVQVDNPIAFSSQMLKWRRKGCALRFPIFICRRILPTDFQRNDAQSGLPGASQLHMWKICVMLWSKTRRNDSLPFLSIVFLVI